MGKKMLSTLVVVLSVIIFCAIAEEGTGQFIDEDKYKISLKLEKEGKYYGVEGSIEHKQDPYKAEVFLGSNLLEIATGEPVDLRTRLDLVAGDLTFKGVGELFDISGDLKTDVRMSLTYTLFDTGLMVGTLSCDTRWINGDMVTDESILKLLGNGWGELGVSRDWMTKVTKLFFGISIPFSPQCGQNISGHIVYGDPLTPRFNCTISGNLTTSKQLPAFRIVTSLTSSINETDPSGMVSEGISQREGGVGGIVLPIDKLVLLAPGIGLATTALSAVAATALYTRRFKRRKEKQ